jgi:hypothetical protein
VQVLQLTFKPAYGGKGSVKGGLPRHKQPLAKPITIIAHRIQSTGLLPAEANPLQSAMRRGQRSPDACHAACALHAAVVLECGIGVV